MAFEFNQKLAVSLQSLYKEISGDEKKSEDFKSNPTAVVKSYLEKNGVEIPDPVTFHAHAIRNGKELPDEPEKATIDRYIYVFHKSGLFEYKIVSGDPDGNDEMMRAPSGACQCCNCCVFEV